MAEGWPEFNEKTGQLTYVLDTDSLETPTVVPWPWAKRCAFWNDYLPKLNTQTGKIYLGKFVSVNDKRHCLSSYHGYHLKLSFFSQE